MKKAYVFLADGFEIIEALTPVDVMRRAGIDVKTVAITDDKSVISSHKIKVEADCSIGEVDFSDGDIIVIPGGYPGYENLKASREVKDIVREYYKKNKLVAAICGGPTVLGEIGILDEREFTSHSAVLEGLPKHNYKNIPVVSHKNVITASGAGNSLPFSFAIISQLVSDEIIATVKKGMELV